MGEAEHNVGNGLGAMPSGMGVGSWRWGIETRTITWSPELRRIYGLSEGERPPMSLSRFIELVHPDDRARVMSTVSETLSTEREGHEHRYRIVRPDGAIRLVLSRARLRRDAQGRPCALDGIDVDLTADMPQQPVAPGDEARLRAVFEAIDEGFCIATCWSTRGAARSTTSSWRRTRSSRS